MNRFATAAALAFIFLIGHAQSLPVQGRIPFIRPSKLSLRFEKSDLVCTAIIVSTAQTANSPVVEGFRMQENLARAKLDRVYKGRLSSREFRFRWFSFFFEKGKSYAYSGPPLANFLPGVRYFIFLREQNGSLEVAIPMYQSEVPLAVEPPAELPADPSTATGEARGRALAAEMVAAMRSNATVPGGYAVEYIAYLREILGKQETDRVLKSLLQAPQAKTRVEAALALTRDGDAFGLPLLRSAVSDPELEPLNRSNVARTLGEVRDSDALPTLQQLAVHDPDFEVRDGALYALREIASHGSIRTLLQALNDTNQMNRYLAASALEKIINGEMCDINQFDRYEPAILAVWNRWANRGGPPPDIASIYRRP
jgi:hypothetical protein